MYRVGHLGRYERGVVRLRVGAPGVPVLLVTCRETATVATGKGVRADGGTGHWYGECPGRGCGRKAHELVLVGVEWGCARCHGLKTARRASSEVVGVEALAAARNRRRIGEAPSEPGVADVAVAMDGDADGILSPVVKRWAAGSAGPVARGCRVVRSLVLGPSGSMEKPPPPIAGGLAAVVGLRCWRALGLLAGHASRGGRGLYAWQVAGQLSRWEGRRVSAAVALDALERLAGWRKGALASQLSRGRWEATGRGKEAAASGSVSGAASKRRV